MAAAGRVVPGRSDFVADDRAAMTIRHGPGKARYSTWVRSIRRGGKGRSTARLCDQLRQDAPGGGHAALDDGSPAHAFGNVQLALTTLVVDRSGIS